MKDVSGAIETVNNCAPETMKEIDELFSSIISAVGYYPSKFKLILKNNLSKFKSELDSSKEKIPEENLQEPSIEIVSPVLENVRYNANSDELRKMYANLLTSAMDSRASDMVHPSYAEIIRQLSSHDARLLAAFPKTESFPFVEIKRRNNSTGGYISIKNHIFIIDDFKDYNKNALSLINLERLGIIKIKYDKFLKEPGSYDHYNEVDIVKLKIIEEGFSREISQHLFSITEFGIDFKEICIQDSF